MGSRIVLTKRDEVEGTTVISNKWTLALQVGWASIAERGGPSPTPSRLPECAQRWRDDAISRAAESDAAYLRAQELKRTVNDALRRARAAVELRREIQALPHDERLQRQIRLYAHIDPIHAPALNQWAAFSILAMASRGAEARELMVAAIRREISSIATMDPDDAVFTQRRLLRAVEYFMPRSITPAERLILQSALAQGQDDLISTVQPQGAPATSTEGGPTGLVR